MQEIVRTVCGYISDHEGKVRDYSGNATAH